MQAAGVLHETPQQFARLRGCRHVAGNGDRAWGVQFHPEFATHHIRGYVAFRGDELRQAGRCPATIARDVTAAPQARKLLRRFVKHARGLHAR